MTPNSDAAVITEARAPRREDERLVELEARYDGLEGVDLLAPLIGGEFAGRIALVSSFGTESAVLVALAAEADPSIPIIFLDTGKLFGETLRYRDELTKLLGLRDVRTIEPAANDLAAGDPDGVLWQSNPDACCHLRKALPLQRALDGFEAW
ncbi:MAG TPA: phosphoadenosine phosphosulfate reductase family protein, partial [Arenibaculum sp.]|nr:phosphoadenosine phosphosulfate reductase family protein [Arenibaculum sp.]